MIESIVGFGAHLQAYPFRYGKRSRHRGVHGLHSRPVNRIAPQVAKGVCRGRRECGGVEPCGRVARSGPKHRLASIANRVLTHYRAGVGCVAVHRNGERTMRKILDAQRAWLSRRSLVYVASEPAKIQVLNGLVSAWPDPPDNEFPLSTGASALPGVQNTEGKESGWVSLILQPQAGIFAAVVDIGCTVVAIRWMTAVHPKPEVAALFSDPQCSPVVVQEQHEFVEAWVDGYFREAPEPLKTWIAETRQRTQSALGRIAAGFLGRWGNDSEAALRCLRSRNRLWDLFGGNRKMFETFVAFGVLRNFDVLLPSLSAALSKRG
jgi:hypothetical protein